MNHAKRRFILAVTLAEHGGVQEFLVRFAHYLQAQGHETIVMAGEGTWLFETCQKRGIPTHKLLHLRRALHPWHDLASIVELYHIFKQLKPDAIHLNSSKMGVLGSLAARLANIPHIVYRIGGWVFLEPLSPFIRWLYQTTERLSARWKDNIICVHPKDATVAKTLRIRPRQRILVIPNGIDMKKFEDTLLPRKNARQKLNLDESTLIFGTIANLFPAKDLARYLEACVKVHEHYPHTQFIILGEGMERKQIEEKRQRLGLNSVVLLPGLIPQAATLLKAFDAFVLPSAKEGMSWALIEAMAAELPCIATDVGANHWLLENDAGWIVPAQNPNALANAMKEIISNPQEAYQRAKYAKTRIEKDFPLQKTLEENVNALFQ